VVLASSSLPPGVADDFFDCVDPHGIEDGANWLRLAVYSAVHATREANHSLETLYVATARAAASVSKSARSWDIGYAMAREVRRVLELDPTSRFDVTPWVGVGTVEARSSGIQGYAVVENARCGLVLGGASQAPSTHTFKQARMLGRVLARPDLESFVLSAVHGHDERVAGAFAAELLVPAEGIREALSGVEDPIDLALDDVAWRFGVPLMVVRHQYENQLAGTAEVADDR
jgi:hypothetical protein